MVVVVVVVVVVGALLCFFDAKAEMCVGGAIALNQLREIDGNEIIVRKFL